MCWPWRLLYVAAPRRIHPQCRESQSPYDAPCPVVGIVQTWCHGDSDVRRITEQPWNCGDGDLVMLSVRSPARRARLAAPLRILPWLSALHLAMVDYAA